MAPYSFRRCNIFDFSLSETFRFNGFILNGVTLLYNSNFLFSCCTASANATSACIMSSYHPENHIRAIIHLRHSNLLSDTIMPFHQHSFNSIEFSLKLWYGQDMDFVPYHCDGVHKEPHSFVLPWRQKKLCTYKVSFSSHPLIKSSCPKRLLLFRPHPKS